MVRIYGADVSGFLLFLVLLNLYFLVLYVLVKTGWLQKLNMSLFGPALMIKTERGRGLLDFLARPRTFWKVVATGGTALTFVVMGLMSLLLIVQLPLVFRVPVSQAPSPSLILGIPGINPIIPLGYGILALIFGVVVHELSHGVLARAHRLRVKTMGLLLLIVPIGAFVEPDEEALKAAPRRKRVQVFGAGPTSNLFFALVFAALFSAGLMAQAAPIPGAPVQGIEKGGPADLAGIHPGTIITHINGQPLLTPADLQRLMGNTTTEIRPNETIQVTTLEKGTSTHHVVHTARRADLYTQERYRQAYRDDPDFANDTVIGVSVYDSAAFYGALAKPYSSPTRALAYFSLPFFALQGQFPLAGAFQDFYAVPFHAPTFWFLANAFYWLFWINLMLGLTNALPILPLDGGHMFRDLVGAWVQRRNPEMPPERRDAVVKRMSLIVTFTLIGLVLLQFVGPYIAAIFQ